MGRTLELTLSEIDCYAAFLQKYHRGEDLLSILLQMEDAKLNILQSLHLLSEELRFFETAIQ